MTLTPVTLTPSCCGVPTKATDLCCAREWIKGEDVGNHTVKGNEDTEEGNGNNYKKSDS